MPRLRTPLQSYGPRPGVKKGRKFEPCDRFTLTYAIQEQQTHLQTTISASACPALFLGRFRVDGDPAALRRSAPALVRGQLRGRLERYQSRECRSRGRRWSTAARRPCRD